MFYTMAGEVFRAVTAALLLVDLGIWQCKRLKNIVLRGRC